MTVTLEKTRKIGRLPGLSVADGFMRHPFDASHGVQTSGLVAGRHLKSGHRHDRHATAYYGVAPSVFHALVQQWQRSSPAAPLDRFTFIDIGAGMGRALLLAAEMRFHAAMGVELHPTLARIARRNLAVWRAAGRMRCRARVFCSDAVDLRIPASPTLTFLFNPFGAAVMRRLLKRLAAMRSARPGALDLLYVNNEQESELERAPAFRRLFRGRIRRSPEDAVADRTILANQPEGEYAFSNYEDCSIWRWIG